MKKLLIAAIALTSAGAAHASFEMALVLDKVTRKVHRFDAVTGAYFGSFGSFITPTSLHIDQSNNEVIVFDANTGVTSSGVAYHYNYNTGMMLRATTGFLQQLTHVGYDPAGSSYLLTNPSSQGYFTYSLDLQTGNFHTLNSGAPTRYDVVDGQRVMFATNGGKIEMANVSTNTSIASLPLGYTPFDYASSGLTAQGYRVGAAVSAAGHITPIFVGPSTITLGLTVTGAGSGFGSITGIAPTHSGFIVVGKSSSGAAQIRTYAFGLAPSLGNSILIPQGLISAGAVTDPADVVTVVAPEPASLLALAAGAATLARRRRARHS